MSANTEFAGEAAGRPSMPLGGRDAPEGRVVERGGGRTDPVAVVVAAAAVAVAAAAAAAEAVFEREVGWWGNTIPACCP